jgi:hypothetical protein
MHPQNKSIPSREEAKALLAEAARMNPGPWEQHSLRVAEAARAIAQHHPELDAERAYILGLLHDIGRRYGVRGMQHVLDGYRFLTELGYTHAARICLTHSYPDQHLVHGADAWDGKQEDLEFVEQYLDENEYDEYDRLIQLCDAVCLPQGFCLMEKRLVEVVMRYGVDQYTLPRWRGYMQVKEDVEKRIGRSIYSILPGVVENTFDHL